MFAYTTCIILISICFASIVSIYKYFSRKTEYWKRKGVNGPKPLPFFGNIIDNFRTPINILEMQRYEKYGKVYGCFEMTQPVLTIGDIDLIKSIAIKDFNCFTNHQNLTPGDPMMSTMMINLQDDDWKRVRNIVTPAFSSAKIKQIFDLVDHCSDNCLDYFNEIATNRKEVDLKKAFLAFAIDAIAISAFGVDINSYKEPDGDFIRHAFNVTDFRKFRTIVGLLMPTSVRIALGFQLFDPSSLHYFTSLMKELIKERRTQNSDYKDLVKLLLDSQMNDGRQLRRMSAANTEILHLNNVQKHKLDDNEILSQCMNMLLAGFETTSTALHFLVYTLAIRPDIQDKLYNEVLNYFDNQEFEYDSLLSLPYLNAVVNETLRHYSPVVNFTRVAGQDYKLPFTNIEIDKGTVINIPFYAVHHNPEYWRNPHEFIPERFLSEYKFDIKPYSFMPFGVGPRTCVGIKLAMLEMKVMVAKLVRRFEVLKTPKTPIEPKYCGKMISLLCEPLFVTFARRNEPCN